MSITTTGRVPSAAAVLPLTKEEPSIDCHDSSDGASELKGDERVSGSAAVGAAVGKEAPLTAAGAEGGQGGDPAAAAHAAAIAAAEEEVASAESHSLTQGAMKLVYLLAIQVSVMQLYFS